MSSSSAVSKQAPKEVSSSSRDGALEEKEESTEASASAGLNLNVFGALSGALSSKSTKTTEADGSSVEEKEEQAHAKGAGGGTLNAAGKADAEQKSHQKRQAIAKSDAKAS